LCAATIALYSILCWHPLLGSYPRYVLSAREMVESGDWVVPHLASVPYFEKPILIYWLGAASQLLFGTSGFAIHLPSLIAALISVLCTYALGRELRSPNFGFTAALLLLGSGQFLVMTSMLTTDPLFASWLALAWLCFRLHERDGRARWIWSFWGALALGWMTKGPLAIVLVGLSLVGYFLLLGGWRALWREAWKMRPIAGVGVIVLLNLPWHWLVWQRDPRFLEMFYVRINLRGLYDNKANHDGPFWFYVPEIAISLVPWTFPAMAAAAIGIWNPLVRAVRERRRSIAQSSPAVATTATDFAVEAERTRLYLACTVVFPLLFLSASASKLGTYILPLLPALVLLAADVIASRTARVPAWLRWSTALQAALLVLAIASALLFFRKRLPLDQLQPEGLGIFAGAAALFVLGQVIGAFRLARGRVVAGMGIAGLGMTLGLCVLLPRIGHVVRSIYAEDLARKAAPRMMHDDRIVVTEHCVQDYTITWATGRRAGVLGKPRELSMGHFTEVTLASEPLPDNLKAISLANLPQNPWLYDLPKLEREWREPRRMWFFACVDPANDVRDELHKLAAAGLEYYEVGRVHDIALVTNQPWIDGP
jgi:4-amino-4-deoxy-L-arabinose transferase-like glycosyltransferase